MQLPHPTRGMELFHHPATAYAFKQSMDLPEPQGLIWVRNPHTSATNPSSTLSPAPFIPLQTKRQREEELRILNPEASSTLLTSCSSSPLLIWRFFSSAAVPSLSRGPQKQGQTAAAFCRKGHLLIACQVRDNVHPPGEGRYHPLCMTFAQCFGTQLCKCTAIRGAVQSLQTHPEPRGQYIQVSRSVYLTIRNEVQGL